jgi:hypothetical protein
VREQRARPVAERERRLGAADVDAEEQRDGVSPPRNVRSAGERLKSRPPADR